MNPRAMTRALLCVPALALSLCAFAIPAAATPIGHPVVGGSLTGPQGVLDNVIDTAGQGAALYRIPGMAVTADGTIVVTYDARMNSAADLPSDINIVSKRSTDNGRTWSARTIVIAHSGSDTDTMSNGVGDGSLLYDARLDRLFLFFEYAPAGVGVNNSDHSTSPTSTTTVHPEYVYSDDDGVSWSRPVDLISQVKTSDMTGIFASSGHGIQLADGTLVQPFAALIGNVWTAFTVYSADHGFSWQRGSSIGPGVSENKVAQLADGTLLDDGRASTSGVHDRMFSASASVTGPWTTPTADPDLPDPQANGDLIRADTIPGRPDFGWLLESNPDSQTARVNGVVRLSRDGGRTWPYSWAVTSSRYPQFGYSVLSRLRSGGYGLVYEHTAGDTTVGGVGGSLVFAGFTLSQFS